MAEQQIKFKNLYSPRSIDTGGAERMQALQRLAGQVGDVAFEIGKQKRIEEGELAGVEAAAKAVETGEYEKPSSFTFFGQAAQDSFQRTYAAKINNQMTQELTAAYEESKGQASPLEYFDTVSNAYLKGMNQSVSADLKPLMDSTYASVQGSFKTQLIGDAIKREQADAKAARGQLYTDLTAQAQLAASANDENGVLAAQERFAAALDTDLTLDTEQRIKLANDFNKGLRLSQSLAGMRAAYRDNLDDGILKASEFIQTIENATLTDVLPGEQEDIIKSLRQDLKAMINEDDSQEDREREALELAQVEEADRLLLEAYRGNLTMPVLIEKLQNNKVNRTGFNAIDTVLQTRGVGVDDQGTISFYEELMRSNPQAAIDQIPKHIGKTLRTGTARQLTTRAVELKNSESVLNNNAVNRYRDYLESRMSVVDPISGFIKIGETKEEQMIGNNILLIFDERLLAEIENGADAKTAAKKVSYELRQVFERFELRNKSDEGSINVQSAVLMKTEKEALDELKRLYELALENSSQPGIVIEQEYDQDRIKVTNYFKNKRLDDEFNKDFQLLFEEGS